MDPRLRDVCGFRSDGRGQGSNAQEGGGAKELSKRRRRLTKYDVQNHHVYLIYVKPRPGTEGELNNMCGGVEHGWWASGRVDGGSWFKVVRAAEEPSWYDGTTFMSSLRAFCA